MYEIIVMMWCAVIHVRVTLLGFKEASEVIMVVRQRAEMLAMLYRVKSPL